MMEYWGSVHWDTDAHCHCNYKFECGNLVEFNLSADCVHECNCTRIPHFPISQFAMLPFDLKRLFTKLRFRCNLCSDKSVQT